MSLDDLYKEVILDHYQHPRNRGQLDEPDVATRGHNPLCGDEILLAVKMDGHVIQDIAFGGRGCSISQASVSAMYDLVIGKSVTEALGTGEHFVRLMQSKGDASVAEELEDELEDAVAFAGVSKYPARIKCALMSWMALKDASARALATTTPGGTP